MRFNRVLRTVNSFHYCRGPGSDDAPSRRGGEIFPSYISDLRSLVLRIIPTSLHKNGLKLLSLLEERFCGQITTTQSQCEEPREGNADQGNNV
jgi:hypothetical protein